MSSDLFTGVTTDVMRPSIKGRPAGSPRHSGIAGQGLPPDADGRKAAAIDRAQLDSAVSAINDYVQNISRDLEFTVDEELNRVVIKIYDAESHEMIRQIPAEEVLQAARQLHKVQGLIFRSKA